MDLIERHAEQIVALWREADKLGAHSTNRPALLARIAVHERCIRELEPDYARATAIIDRASAELRSTSRPWRWRVVSRFDGHVYDEGIAPEIASRWPRFAALANVPDSSD